MAGAPRRPYLGARLLHRPVPARGRRTRPHPLLRGRQPVHPRVRARRGASQPRGSRHPTRVDGVEPDRLPGLPGPHPPFLLRVRIPGPTHLANPDRLDPRRAPHPHLTDFPPAPDRLASRTIRSRPATQNSIEVPPPTRRPRTPSRTATGPPSTTRLGRSSSASSTSARSGHLPRVPSTGRSTTAGRSPPGRPW